MAPTIVTLQGSVGCVAQPVISTSNSTQLNSLDEIGKELMKCCQGLDLNEVVNQAIKHYKSSIISYFTVILCRS